MSGANHVEGAARLPRFKAYAAYKDSGVEWLGEIPAGWEVRRLRSTVASCQNGVWGDEPDGLHDITCVRVADFNRVTLTVDIAEPTLRSVESSVVATRGLRPGDLLLEKSGGGEKQPVGAVVLFDHQMPAICSNFIARVTLADAHDPRYQTFLHAAMYAQRINTRHIKQSTGIQNLDSSSYLNEAIGLPPEREQRAIAAFLDREVARIDALVAKNERLIELLQEQRSAVITRTVTKGLDPGVHMKDSGVEWLGEIAESWKFGPLKYSSGGLTVGVVVRPAELYSPTGAPFIRATNISSGRVSDSEMMFISENDNRANDKSRLAAGDIILVRTGRTGTAVVVPPEYAGANCVGLLIVRHHPRFSSAYLSYYLNSSSGMAAASALSFGAVQAQFNTAALASTTVPCPPRDEQDAIASFLDQQTARIDALVAKVHQAIDRLKELRASLISAAVTGKIDVREGVA